MWNMIVGVFSQLGGFILEYTLGKSLDYLIQRKPTRKLSIKGYGLIPDIYGIDALKVLLDEHDLRRQDLIDIFGTKADCSDVLDGRQPLTFDHIHKLSGRFHISPLVFFPKGRCYR